MNLIPKGQRITKSGRSLACLFGASLLFLTVQTSCNAINEDLPPCAPYPNTFTRVNFVYDYNMYEEDLFDKHVGTAHLYVFDKDSVFLFDRSLSRNEMPGDEVDFSMTFDTTYIKPGKKYLMLAMAQGNHAGYEWSTVVTPGFQIPLENQMIPGVSKISDYRIMLDRDSDSYADIGIVDFTDAYGNNRAMLDTLWSTKPGSIQSVSLPYIVYEPQPEAYEVPNYEVFIPMMRITNSITVNLLNDAFNTNFDPNSYNILIDFPKGNGTIGFTGRTYPNRELFYRALRKDMIRYQRTDGSIDVNGSENTKSETRAEDVYAIHAEFGVSRLQTTDNSSLQIRNAATNEIIFKIGDEDANVANGKSFSQWLADYFNNEYDYESQEFLDREYNFVIDIHFDGTGTWDWYEIRCEILGWGERVYNYIIK